jgi:hypothetical protein
MAAGQGFKTFATGDVLSAADVNGYLMQGVLVFADSAERDAEITSPEEGQFAYLKDTNVTTYYTGSVWANLDTTGMTNPMTTTGDVIYSSSGSTPARLGIGTAGQVLQVNSGATAPEWATPAGGGGKVLQVVNATYATEFTSSSSTFADTGLTATITPSSASSKVLVLVSANGIGKNFVDTAFGGRVLRGATSIIGFEGGGGNTGSTARNIVGGTSVSYLDTPATTSATTYKVQGQSTDNAATAYMNWRGYGASTITLLEIGA